MQSTENKVACFSCGQCQANGLEVTHLADENYVGVFAQCRAQGFVKAERVAMHFALIDQGLLGLVHELDWILDGEDMVRFVLVDVVNHRCKRCRLTGTRWTRNQHDASWMHRDVLENGR